MFSIISFYPLLIEVLVQVKSNDDTIVRYETDFLTDKFVLGESSQMMRLGDFCLQDIESISLQWNYKSKKIIRNLTINWEFVSEKFGTIKDFIIGINENQNIILWGMTDLKSVLISLTEIPNVYAVSPKREQPYMRKYNYRYVIFDGFDFLHAEVPQILECTEIKEKLYDGTFDKVNDGSLYQYHIAAMPKMLTIRWKETYNIDFSAHIWFRYDKISDFFEHFYGLHPDTRTDFIVSISKENKGLSLFFFRQRMKAPIPISASTYEY